MGTRRVSGRVKWNMSDEDEVVVSLLTFAAVVVPWPVLDIFNNDLVVRALIH